MTASASTPLREHLPAILLSVQVSATATLLILIPGTLLGVWMAGTRSRFRTVVDTITIAPLVVPPVVTGVLLLYLLRTLERELLFTWWAAVAASAVIAAPLLVRTVRTSVEGVDPRYGQIAATLGASRLRSLCTITFPMAWRGIAGGALLAWARAAGEFGATIVVAGNIPGRTRTIPLAIWTEMQSTAPRGIAVLLVASLVLCIGAVVLSELIVGRWGWDHVRPRTRPD